MKLQDLKPGQKISVYCFGELVDAKVIQSDGIGVCVEHKPVRWGNDVCINTWVRPSSYLQAAYAKVPTTPGAFYKGKRITV